MRLKDKVLFGQERKVRKSVEAARKIDSKAPHKYVQTEMIALRKVKEEKWRRERHRDVQSYEIRLKLNTEIMEQRDVLIDRKERQSNRHTNRQQNHKTSGI